MAEIAEGDRESARADIGHVFGLDHRIAEQAVGLALDQPRLPDEGAVGGLELAHFGERGRIHNEARALPVARLECVDEVNQPRIRRAAQPVGRAGAQILQRPEGARAISGRRYRNGEEAPGLVGARTADEGSPLGAGEFQRDFAGEPVLEIEAGIVEHRLAGRRIGIEVARGRGDLGKFGRVGLGPCGGFANPAAGGAAGGHQLAIARAARLHDLRDCADRADRSQFAGDRRVDLARHGIAAIGGDAGRERFNLGGRSAPQIAIDKALHLGCGLIGGADRRARRGAANLVDARLDLVDIAAQRPDLGFGLVLAGDDIEARFCGIGGGSRFHRRVLFLQGTKKPPGRRRGVWI